MAEIPVNASEIQDRVLHRYANLLQEVAVLEVLYNKKKDECEQLRADNTALLERLSATQRPERLRPVLQMPPALPEPLQGLPGANGSKPDGLAALPPL